MENKIGNLIKKIRIDNNMTQKDFADKFGVTYQAVSKWENGKNIPDISLLKEISREYNISIDEFLDNEVYKKESNNKVYIIIGVLLTIIVFLLIFNVFKKDDFEFKTLSSDCSNFTISGSVAYNKKKSSIHISEVLYCGVPNNTKYAKLIATLYEENDDFISKVSTNTLVNEKGALIQNYLEDLTLIVDHSDSNCNIYKGHSLYLEIEASTLNGELQTYKIPLKLEENC